MVDLASEIAEKFTPVHVGKNLYRITVQKIETKDREVYYESKLDISADTREEAEKLALKKAKEISELDWDEVEDWNSDFITDITYGFPDEDYCEIIDETSTPGGLTDEAFKKLYGLTRLEALRETNGFKPLKEAKNA